MESRNCYQILIYVQPGSKSSAVAGEFDGRLKIKISSPPVDGQANEALTKFIALKLGIRIRDVNLVAGTTSRMKTFEILGVTAEEISRKLLL